MNMQKRVHGRVSSIRGFRDMRSPVSSTPWARALPDGKWGNESESAGTEGIAAIATPAVEVIS
jgi:hypothetical protein